MKNKFLFLSGSSSQQSQENTVIVVGKKRPVTSDAARPKRKYQKYGFRYFPDKVTKKGAGGDLYFPLMDQFISKRVMFRVLDDTELELLLQVFKIPRNPDSHLEAQKKFLERWRAR